MSIFDLFPEPLPKLVVHCWEGGPYTDDGCSTTCMLPRDHKGPHEWTRDDEVRIAFAKARD